MSRPIRSNAFASAPVFTFRQDENAHAPGGAMTTTTCDLVAVPTACGDRVSTAARHLYEADCALHIARQSAVDTWISAAYDHLHRAVVDYEAAVAAS